MEILKSSSNLSPREMYFLTKAPTIEKMTAHVGETINPVQFMIYNDISANGDSHIIASIKTEAGKVYATNSPTFVREFTDLIDMFGDELIKIHILQMQSKAGRNYITCVLAD